ncbi:MAG: hypothetical protein OXH79_03525 [Boseongicola sp.]|nr:hypothetical protein [Boseongicola sp.]
MGPVKGARPIRHLPCLVPSSLLERFGCSLAAPLCSPLNVLHQTKVGLTPMA